MKSLIKLNSFNIKLILESLVVGILTGFVIVISRIILEEAGQFTVEIYKILTEKTYLIQIRAFVLIIVSLIVGKMLIIEPMISGSGIPQVEGIIEGKLHVNWWKVLIGKFIGGVLCIGSGLSLGREGPSVQLGAAIGQGFGNVFKRTELKEKYLITGGASAGLAAAFNAPLAGVMFALEEVHKTFSPLILLSAMTAALSADYVSRGFFGLKPVLYFDKLTLLPLNSYLSLLVLGAILGALGALFNKVLLYTQKNYSKIKCIPKEYRILIPLILSIAIGLLLPQVLGGGHNLIVGLLDADDYNLKIILILLIVKFLFTMLCYGTGAPGGIFLPLLSIGALIGCVYGYFMINVFNFDSIYMYSFIVLSMAGYFSAVVRGPITGIILITEMTGSFSYFLSISIVSITSYIFANLLGSKPIYESLLENLLQKQNKTNGTT